MTLRKKINIARRDYQTARYWLGSANRGETPLTKSHAMRRLNVNRHRLQQVVLEATYILYPSGRIGG